MFSTTISQLLLTHINQSKRVMSFTSAFFLFSLLNIYADTSFSEGLVLNESTQEYALGRYIEFFEDKDKTITIKDILHDNGEIDFQKSDSDVPSFGFTSSAFWFRLNISNPNISDQTFFLEVKNSYIDQVDFFKRDDSSRWISKRTGELFPLSTREIKTGNFVFQLDLPKGSTNVFYLRFEGDSSLDIPLKIYTNAGFLERQFTRNLHTGFYFGIIFIMMLTSLFLFFQIRDLSLFYYFLYLATQPLVYSNSKGLIGQYLWSQYPFWANQGFFFFFSLTHICFLLFTRAFLDTSIHSKLLDRILLIEIFILTGCIIPGLFVPYQVGVQFLMVSIIVYQSTALLAGIACFSKGRKVAGYFLIAFTPMIVSTIIFILLKMNILPNSKAIVGFFQVNHFLKLSLLSIAIIGRVKLLYDDKQIALERINLIKDEFLAKTSHELRTPLHGIIGLTESIIDQSSKNNLPESIRKQLEVIMAAGKRLASLVNDILDISRLKNKDINLRRKPLDFYQLTEIVLTLSKPLTTGKNLKLLNAIPKNTPAIFGDEDRMQQVMHNLVGNAIKFTDAGEIKVTAREAETNNRIVFSISDTGRGIPEDQLGTIFKSFEQVGSPDTDYSQGAGLGLSIVEYLVDLHGGRVKVVSQVGKGSVFSFDLPISSLPVEHVNDSSLEVSEANHVVAPEWFEQTEDILINGKRFNILVVDDEPTNLQVVTNHLTEQGFNLKAVTSGEAALSEVNSNTPQLVLLDVMMPRMSGFEVCKKIRENHSKSQIAIIFLTAKNQVTDLVEGFELGANDYLTKPFSKNELLTRVNYHLETYQVANRLQCLTDFSCRISRLNDLRKVFKEAFKLICEQISIDHGALVVDDEVIDKYGESIDRQVINEILVDLSDDFTSIKHFRLQEILVIHPKFSEDFKILVAKDNHHIFREIDIEFIRNIVTTIKITRDNLREIISDARFLSGLNQIRENHSKVICIKSNRNYCSIICDDSPQDSFELRISIQMIQTFFKDSELLKINRSTLINPSKIKSLQRETKQKFSVTMNNGEVLVISRSLEKQVRIFLSND